MRDVVLVALKIAFFAVCFVYIAGCARIIGSDAATELDAEPESAEALP